MGGVTMEDELRKYNSWKMLAMKFIELKFCLVDVHMCASKDHFFDQKLCMSAECWAPSFDYAY